MSITNASNLYPLKITVILNPKAGRGRAGNQRMNLEKWLDEATKQSYEHTGKQWKWDLQITQGPGNAIDLARQASQSGAHLVVAAGGDGTLNEVVNGIVGTEARLGLLPLGTGNDFARCLGLEPDLQSNVMLLMEGAERPIDLGKVIIDTPRYFLNIAGCGFDALVAERANRGFPFLHGTAAYLAAVGHALLHMRPANFTLSLDGTTYRTRALMCSVANATSYGGGMRVAPDARIDDGMFDICLLKDAGRLEFLKAFPSVFKGTHTTHPRVSMYRASDVSIESDPPLPLLIDGEVIGTTPVHYTIQKHAIRMVTRP